MKKFNTLINMIMVFGAGIFVESLYAAYRDFINHPEVYEINSAPWYYYSAIPNAVAFVAFMILCLLIKLAIHKRAGRIILGVLAAIVGVLWMAITLYTSTPHSYTIIGGADGPTSIFLAGKYGAGTIITAVVGGLVLAIAGIILIVKKGNKSDSKVD
ncbi:Trp biosynthesis-associated membrane protein [Butyrivibrio sp. MC2021]|uniref:Trp biosynthesis-associated membrane protein n=1 Tax=Butyrivibrio sp. MC2021 TaxID=1408306 RepID=UPI000688D1F8|nr:Trp biosynthesis-associated membrane protein [Butyrivibrio sp. MC2021]